MLQQALSGKTVLVTGGAGFVGSNIVKRLIELGVRVIVLDNLFTGERRNVPQVPTCTFVEGSVCDFDLVKSMIEQADYVIHAAAANIIASTADPRTDLESNVLGTLNVLLAISKTRPNTPIVYTSSASVYGNPKHLPINEDDECYTLSPYAVSKRAGENYCIAFYETYSVPVSVVRYSNVYGPGQSTRNPYCGAIAKFISWCLNGEPPRIHGDGEQTRDFTYVEDVVEGTLRGLISPRSVGQVFNLGSGFETSINELVRRIMAACGFEGEPVYIDKRDIDNIRRRVVNVEKARRILRWTPNVLLHAGLRRTIDWTRSEFDSANT